MIIKDDINQYIPMEWTLVHPLLYEEVLKALGRDVQIELKHNTETDKLYWRRHIDKKELELGL